MVFMDVLPLLAVIVLLALRRTTLLQAGLIGLVLTLPAAYAALPGQQGFFVYLVRALGEGAWLAWQALSVILAGLVFHNINKAAHPDLFESGKVQTDGFSYRRLFSICFLLGPFFESASGFGVGMIITLPFLLRMGIAGPMAVVFALFSQILVPWGALGVGSVVGAGLANAALQEIGVKSALISIPLLCGYLVMFWRLAARQGHAASVRQKLDDVAWVGALALLLYLANRFIAVETAGLFSTGVLLLARYWRDARPSAVAWRAALRPATPYLALTAVLLMTRTIPPLRALLQHTLVVQPAQGMAPFPVFYHVSFWLLATALFYAFARGAKWAQWDGVLHQVWAAARIPLAVTLTFVVMAQIMASSGIAAQLAHAWGAVAGEYAAWAAPLFAAVAGFLTGSNVSANAIMMPLQSALASQSAHNESWLAAMQNTAGSNLTMLSAVRVAMGCALVRITGQEHDIYRQAWPMGATVLAILLVTMALL